MSLAAVSKMKGDRRIIEHMGEYLEIDPPCRLVFSLIHSQLPHDAGRSHREGGGAMLDRMSGCLTQKEGLRYG